MGGLGPGIGGLEYLLIAAVTLIVVGPERLPGLLRKLGQMLGKARRMADEFRHSFDEMARQSELDDLRKEVEALRTNQTMVRLGDEADATFKDIKTELNQTDPAPTPVPTRAERFSQPAGNGVDEWPDTPPVMTPLEPLAEVEPVAAKPKAAPPKTAVKAAAAKTSVKAPAKTPASRAAPAKTVSTTVAKPRSRAIKNSKLDL